MIITSLPHSYILNSQVISRLYLSCFVFNTGFAQWPVMLCDKQFCEIWG